MLGRATLSVRRKGGPSPRAGRAIITDS